MEKEAVGRGKGEVEVKGVPEVVEELRGPWDEGLIHLVEEKNVLQKRAPNLGGGVPGE